MHDPSSRQTRVRWSLARVLAVLALVAGVALMQGTPCETEIAWTAQCATSSTHVITAAPADDGGTTLLDAILVAGMFLAVALAVLIALTGLRLPGHFTWRLNWQLVALRPSRRQEVRLAQLCVLRT